VSSLSGGERSRLALAALLTRQPECLLLDEPTNHLDGPALAFLEETVRALPGVVVFASHDRTFLDAVAHTVVDLDPAAPGADGRGGTRSSAGYTAYVSTKRAARQRWEERYDSQQTDLADLRRTAATTARRVAPGRAARDNDKSLHNFKGEKVQGTVSRRVRDAERRIEVLQRELLPRPPAPLRFDAPLTRTDGVQVVVRDLEVPGRLHLPALDVPVGARLLVTGRNGSGKSTLLGVLAGRVRPARGQVGVGARRTGFLPQDVVFPHPGRTAREICPDAGRLGLLHPRDLDRPVTVLSEGQRRRLALATLVARQPDLLLLDEPTNHISLALAEELEEALGRSAGTVLVATHDRWLRRRWEGETVRLGA
jgi:macrolide transport system ATP-binding/permease protein